MFDADPTNKDQNKASNPKGQPPKQGKKAFKPPKKITEKYLYNAGLAYLQRFPASSHHFETVMGRKITKSCRYHTDQSEEDCIKLLKQTTLKFQELGLLNDDAYTKGMVSSYRRRGMSSKQISMKLSMKGIPSEKVQKALREYENDEYGTDTNGDLRAALIFAKRKKIGPFDLTGQKEPHKMLGIMARAGYSYDISKKILEISEMEAEQLFVD